MWRGSLGAGEPRGVGRRAEVDHRDSGRCEPVQAARMAIARWLIQGVAEFGGPEFAAVPKEQPVEG